LDSVAKNDIYRLEKSKDFSNVELTYELHKNSKQGLIANSKKPRVAREQLDARIFVLDREGSLS